MSLSALLWLKLYCGKLTAARLARVLELRSSVSCTGRNRLFPHEHSMTKHECRPCKARAVEPLQHVEPNVPSALACAGPALLTEAHVPCTVCHSIGSAVRARRSRPSQYLGVTSVPLPLPPAAPPSEAQLVAAREVEERQRSMAQLQVTACVNLVDPRVLNC